MIEHEILNIRKTLGMTQDELAKKCNVSRQTINSIERDKYVPSLELAFKISKELNTKIDKLFIYIEEN